MLVGPSAVEGDLRALAVLATGHRLIAVLTGRTGLVGLAIFLVVFAAGLSWGLVAIDASGLARLGGQVIAGDQRGERTIDLVPIVSSGGGHRSAPSPDGRSWGCATRRKKAALSVKICSVS